MDFDDFADTEDLKRQTARDKLRLIKKFNAPDNDEPFSHDQRLIERFRQQEPAVFKQSANLDI